MLRHLSQRVFLLVILRASLQVFLQASLQMFLQVDVLQMAIFPKIATKIILTAVQEIAAMV